MGSLITAEIKWANTGEHETYDCWVGARSRYIDEDIFFYFTSMAEIFEYNGDFIVLSYKKEGENIFRRNEEIVETAKQCDPWLSPDSKYKIKNPRNGFPFILEGVQWTVKQKDLINFSEGSRILLLQLDKDAEEERGRNS